MTNLPQYDDPRQSITYSYHGRVHKDDNGKFWYVFADVYETLHLENHPSGYDGFILFSDLPDKHKLEVEGADVIFIDKTAFVQLATEMGQITMAWALYLFTCEMDYAKPPDTKPTPPKRKDWRDNPKIKQQFIRQKGLCYYCHEPLLDGWIVEHVKPRAKGGEDKLYNLVIACQSCNAKKGSKSPHEWPEGGRLC